MKTLLKAAVAATVATGLFAAPSFAANTATEPFTAKAKIVKPLTLVKKTDLDFGTVTMTAALTTSTVFVGRNDGPASSCGANLTCTPPTAASFDVTGVALQQLDIDLSTVTALVHKDDNSKSVAFTASPDATVTLDALGVGSFDIGGSIIVTASTADGEYEADVDVTVSYL